MEPLRHPTLFPTFLTLRLLCSWRISMPMATWIYAPVDLFITDRATGHFQRRPAELVCRPLFSQLTLRVTARRISWTIPSVWNRDANPTDAGFQRHCCAHDFNVSTWRKHLV